MSILMKYVEIPPSFPPSKHIDGNLRINDRMYDDDDDDDDDENARMIKMNTHHRWASVQEGL